MDFKAFMKENALAVENKKLVVSKRFIEDGKPVEWEIRAITNEENDLLSDTYTKMVPAPGKAGRRGQMIPQRDNGAYMNAIVAACVVYPDLDNAALQDSYGVKDATALLSAMLTPGELNDLAAEVQTHCGFDVEFEDRVDEAKNS